MPDQPAETKSPRFVLHTNPVHIWAAGIKTPLRYTDKDARLREGDRHTDQTYGQNGWHVSLEFSTFTNLVDQLAAGRFALPNFVCGNSLRDCGPIEENQIARLAISAHGGPGGVDIDGIRGRDFDSAVSMDPTMLNVLTLPRHAPDFIRLERVLHPRAKVFFISCLTGADTVGEAFLKAVSLLWTTKEIMVFGYTTILYTDVKQKKPGSISCFPGARETHHNNLRPFGTSIIRYYEKPETWNDLGRLPWAGETTSHAVMAYKGVLLKAGLPGNFAGLPPAGP